MRLAAAIDADAELLVRGEAPPGADPELVELAAFARELRVAYARPPAEAAGERQLAAIFAETAAVSAGSAVAGGRGRARGATWNPPARRGRRLAFRLAAAGLATLLAATGLAVAGAKPPKPIDDVLQRVGIGGGEEAAQPAGGVGGDSSDAAGSGARGEGSGQAIGAAKGGGQGEPGARGEGDQNRSESGTINSAPGEATAGEARTGRTPPPSPGRSGQHAPEGTEPPASPGSQGLGTGRSESRPEGKGDFGQGTAEEARNRSVPPQ